jgi:hypothetical protein
MNRAVQVAREEFALRAPVSTPDTGRLRTRVAGWAGVLLVLIGLGFTEPGQSVARHMVDLIGIGDEPTEPPIFESQSQDSNHIVIGVGDLPSGARYEVIASRYGSDSAAPLCFRMSFPGLKEHGGLQCLTQAAQSNFGAESTRPVAYAAPSSSGAGVIVAGIVGDDVATVQVQGAEGDGQPLDAHVYRLDTALKNELQADIGAGYFFAALESRTTHPQEIQVRSFDAQGQLIGVTGVVTTSPP